MIAGAPVPAIPDELVAVIDTILRGAFTGDFAVALDRAAAFCRVQASGATHLADDYEPSEPARARASPRGRCGCPRWRGSEPLRGAPGECAPSRTRAGHNPARVEKPDRRNASRRRSARSDRRWSPGFVRPGSAVYRTPGRSVTGIGRSAFPGARL